MTVQELINELNAAVERGLPSTTTVVIEEGGWYTIPDEVVGSDDQRAHGAICGYVSRHTIGACVTRGWLAENGATGIYAKRWTITAAGRAALAEAETR